MEFALQVCDGGVVREKDVRDWSYTGGHDATPCNITGADDARQRSEAAMPGNEVVATEEDATYVGLAITELCDGHATR